jgi:hypothetical protein
MDDPKVFAGRPDPVRAGNRRWRPTRAQEGPHGRRIPPEREGAKHLTFVEGLSGWPGLLKPHNMDDFRLCCRFRHRQLAPGITKQM